MAQEQSRALSRIVVVIGLTLTTIIALLQQSNAQSERKIMFDAASDRIELGIVDRVDLQISEFDSGNNFIAATHPGPIDEYMDFFTKQVDMLSDQDPGVLFVEIIDLDALDQLVERERRLGNPDFEVTLLPGTAEERTILTRLSRNAEVFGLSLLGLDVSTFRAQFLPPQVEGRSFEMFVVGSDDLASLKSPTHQQSAPQYGEFVQFLVGAVSDSSSELLGYSIKFQPVNSLYQGFTDEEWEHLNMELYVEGIEEPIGGRTSPFAPRFDEAELASSREVMITSLEWRIEVWADPDFGRSSGLFRDELWVWLAGLTLTVIAYAATVRRRHQRERLDAAHFELAHVRTLAQTDALTGLLNRNGLIDSARQVALDRSASVFFIDLDGFKSVNDSDGHEQGDQVLRAVALELRAIFRSNDLVARIGGDEFVVFTQHAADVRYLTKASARITEAVSTIDARVTCSIGVASRTATQRTDVKDLMRAADAAMYEAKREGGNRYAIRTQNAASR